MYYFEGIRTSYSTPYEEPNFDQFYTINVLEFIWAEGCNSFNTISI